MDTPDASPMWDPHLDEVRDRSGRLIMTRLRDLPEIACLCPPSTAFASAAIRQALLRLEEGAHGRPSRVLLRDPSHGGTACTATWSGREDGWSVTLRVRTSPGTVHVHLRDPAVGADGIDLSMQDLVPAPRPDDRDAAVAWCVDIAVLALRTAVAGAVSNGFLGDRDELRPRAADRHNRDYRHIETAASLMRTLTGEERHASVGLGLPMPWSHGTWAPNHVDAPLTATETGRMVEARLRRVMPPSVRLDPLRDDGLSFRITRDSHLVHCEPMSSMDALRTLAEWGAQ